MGLKMFKLKFIAYVSRCINSFQYFYYNTSYLLIAVVVFTSYDTLFLYR